MKKYLKVLCSALTTLTVMGSSLPVFAATAETDVTVSAASSKAISQAKLGIYDEDIINAEWEKANDKSIKKDKGSNKSLTSNIATTASTITSGTYPTRKGVILVTADFYKGLIPTGHAAIVYSNSTVVESLADGVTTGPNDWNTAKETCYGVTVEATTATQDKEAANYCYNQIGKPYNWNYFNSATREKFYCSQLVYASYLDLYDIDLDTDAFGNAVHPMEIVNSDNTYKVYSKEA